MEQIIITRLNGSQHPIAKRKDACYMTSASQSITLLGADTVAIQVKSATKQEYFIGDTIEVYGRSYKLNRMPKVNKESANSFTYDLEFEGIQYDLARCTYDLTIDTTNNEMQDVSSNSLIGDLRVFAEVLISNANRVFAGKWVLGDVPETVSDKNLSFSESDNCLSVLQKLCTEFDTEFEIAQSNGVNTVHFKKVGQEFSHQFVYGRGGGLYNLSRQNVSTDNIVTRLKVYGANENITAKYRALRLCLPDKTKGASYIEKPELVAKYGIWEGVKYFDDVKPSRTGKITALGSDVCSFVDNQMNFDLNEKNEDGETTYLLGGVTAKIHFNTGCLAGYDFELSKYDHGTKTFKITPINDERGMKFPSATSNAFKLQVGDEYKILDITLPQTYIDAAETELASKGEMEYQQVSQPQVQYALKVTKLWLEKLLKDTQTTNFFMPGDYIPIKDDDVDVDKLVRVQTIKRDIIDEYMYDLTISDTTTTASLASQVVAELKEIDTTIKTNHLNDPSRARSNWRSTREVMNMVFDPEGDYYSEKIKPLSIDTTMLSVGSKSMQFTLQDNKFVPNLDGDINEVGVTGGKLIHYTIVENGARIWNLHNTTVTLDSATTAYYIYAKCTRDASDGYIIFSESTIEVEEDASYYHFLLGVLNSVDPVLNIRTISLMYGFTTINGKYVTTGVIQSTDGNNYFDLDGNKFKIGNTNNSLSFNENGDGRLRLKGAMIISPSGEESVADAFRGAWSSSKMYYEGDVVTFASDGKTSSYRYCSSTERSGETPGTSQYWVLTASGGVDGATGVNAKPREYHYLLSTASTWTDLKNDYADWEVGPLPSEMNIADYPDWQQDNYEPTCGEWDLSPMSLSDNRNRWATYREYNTETKSWGSFVKEYIDANWVESAKPREYLYFLSSETTWSNLDQEVDYLYRERLPSGCSVVNKDRYNPSYAFSSTPPSLEAGKHRWATYREYNTTTKTWGAFVKEYIETNWAKSETATTWFMGSYSNSTSYTGSTTRRDVVNYNGHSYIAKTSTGSFSNKTPDNTSYWESFGLEVESIATQVLCADGANIANFIFANEQLTSQKRTNDIPNLSLNGKTGNIKMLMGEIGDFKIEDNDIIGYDTNGAERIHFTMDNLPSQNMMESWKQLDWEIESHTTGAIVANGEITKQAFYDVRTERDDHSPTGEVVDVNDQTYLDCRIAINVLTSGKVKIRCADFYRTSYLTQGESFYSYGNYNIIDDRDDQVSSGNLGQSDIEFNAPWGGIYYLDITIHGNIPGADYDCNWDGEIGIDMAGATYSIAPQKTLIGADGFTSYFGALNHLYYKQNEVFSCFIKGHGLKITANGIETTSNGGNTWKTI